MKFKVFKNDEVLQEFTSFESAIDEVLFHQTDQYKFMLRGNNKEDALKAITNYRIFVTSLQDEQKVPYTYGGITVYFQIKCTDYTKEVSP